MDRQLTKAHGCQPRSVADRSWQTAIHRFSAICLETARGQSRQAANDPLASGQLLGELSREQAPNGWLHGCRSATRPIRASDPISVEQAQCSKFVGAFLSRMSKATTFAKPTETVPVRAENA